MAIIFLFSYYCPNSIWHWYIFWYILINWPLTSAQCDTIVGFVCIYFLFIVSKIVVCIWFSWKHYILYVLWWRCNLCFQQDNEHDKENAPPPNKCRKVTYRHKLKANIKVSSSYQCADQSESALHCIAKSNFFFMFTSNFTVFSDLSYTLLVCINELLLVSARAQIWHQSCPATGDTKYFKLNMPETCRKGLYLTCFIS